MDGPHLFEAMYSEDAEGQKLKEMPGVDELLVVYPLLQNWVCRYFTFYQHSIDMCLCVCLCLCVCVCVCV